MLTNCFFILAFWLALILPQFSQAENKDLDSLHQVLASQPGPEDEVKTMVRLARAYFFTDKDSSLLYFSGALEAANRENDPHLIAFAEMSLGDFYNFRGEYARSLGYYLNSLEKFQDLKETKYVASIQNNMGLLYKSIGSQDDALMNYELALAYYGSEGQKVKEATILNNIGSIYLEKERLDSAMQFFEQALAIWESTGDYKGSVYHNMGDLYRQKGDTAAARKYYALAMEEKEAYELTSTKVKTYTGMGMLEMDAGQLPRALSLFEEAYALGIRFRLREELIPVTQHLAHIHARSGRYEQAYEFSEQARLYQDSVHHPDLVRDLVSLGVDRQVKQKDLENELLKRDQELTQAQLDNTERLVLFAIIGLVLTVVSLLWIFRLYQRKESFNRQLNVLNQDLEARVSQRTRSLEQKNEQLERYAFDLSHRVRSPVASILGLVNLLDARDDVSEETRSYLDGVKSKAEQLDEVLHKMNRDLE